MTPVAPWHPEWLLDRVAEAWSAIAGRPWRAALTALATAVGVAGYVGVTGTSTMAERDVQRRFELLRPTSLIANAADARDDTFGVDGLAGVERLPGVEGAILTQEVTLNPKGDATSSWAPETSGASVVREARIEAVAGTGWAALHGQVTAGRMFDAGHGLRRDRVAVLGSALAADLRVDRISTGSVVVLGHVPFTVIGIASGFDDYPELRAAAFVPREAAVDEWGATYLDTPVVSIRASREAVPDIARRAPHALRPDRPSAVRMSVAAMPTGLRRAVASDLSTLVLVLSLIVFGSGGLSIATNSLASVLERRSEIGLRRALGARTLDLTAQFLAESTLMGALGGAAGALLGQGAIVVYAAARGTDPVALTTEVLLAPAMGAALGFLAGVAPAIRAGRIEPVEALRGT